MIDSCVVETRFLAVGEDVRGSIVVIVEWISAVVQVQHRPRTEAAVTEGLDQDGFFYETPSRSPVAESPGASLHPSSSR